ncbi:MAG: hypothetical protein IKR81_06380, partial [Victivallales bacterium]|nr:hypothetical protein [Victivallales bacterium]
IGEVMAKRISDGLVEKQAYIQELRKEFQLSQLAPAPEGDTICFTGKSTRPRSEMHQAARDKGLVPVDAVTPPPSTSWSPTPTPPHRRWSRHARWA